MSGAARPATPARPLRRRPTARTLSSGGRDGRTGQTWSASQRIKNDLIYVSVRALLALADHLPARMLLGWCRACGRAAHRMLPALGARARHNLRLALPECDAPQVARQSFVEAGQNLGLTLLLRRARPAALELVSVAANSAGVLRETLAEGRGALVVSAHLGPFELIAAAVAELGYCPAVVVRESYDRRLDPLVDQHRMRRGVEVIHRGRSGAAARILRALRDGRPVGLLPDLGGRVPSAPTRLLGQQVAMPVGPQRIAVRASCPVVIATLAPLAQPRRAWHARQPTPLPRFELRLTRLLERNEQQLGERVACILSERIRDCPEQWLWMAPRFAPTQSSGSDSRLATS